MSYLANRATTTDAALRKEGRTRPINATALNRKSGDRSGPAVSLHAQLVVVDKR